MAIAFWLVSATAIAVSSALSTIGSNGFRVALLGLVLLAMTPLGFIDGPGLPIFLAEVFLATFTLAVIVRHRDSMSAITVPWFLFIYCAFCLLQILIALLLADVTVVDLARDARPLAYMGLLLLISAILKQASSGREISENLLSIMVVACLVMDIVYYVAAHFGIIAVGGISGEFLVRTGIVRYTDLMTITAFGLSNYFVFMTERRSKAWFWLAIGGVVVLLSLNRVFAAGFILALSWLLGKTVGSWTRSKIASTVAALMPMSVLVLAGIWLVESRLESGEFASRITELFDLNLLVSALEYRFIEPAVVGGYELTAKTFLIGEGIGFRFYIPWFEYRGLDPWHFSVDSLLAFGFFKYGMLGLALLCVAVSRCLWMRAYSAPNAWIWIYLVAHSGVNVPGFLLFLVILVVIRDSSWLLMVPSSDFLRVEKAHEVLH